jgi:quercetin dioxygenase-like cupin family protein
MRSNRFVGTRGCVSLYVVIRAGDIVWFEPGEKHWHGASPTTAMTHIAIAEMLDGKAVEWMEHVSDKQYGG